MIRWFKKRDKSLDAYYNWIRDYNKDRTKNW